MSLFGKDHYEMMDAFEREFRGMRMDREAKEWWAKGNIYQNGETNAAFLAFRKGVALGMALAR